MSEPGSGEVYADPQHGHLTGGGSSSMLSEFFLVAQLSGPKAG